MTSIPWNKFEPVPVPSKVSLCPICDAPIVIEDLGEWEAETGKPLHVDITCTTEPDIDSDEWHEWHRGHWSTPYIDWLPVERQVLTWFQRTHRIVEKDE